MAAKKKNKTKKVKNVKLTKIAETENDWLITWDISKKLTNVKEYSVKFQYYAYTTKYGWKWITGSTTTTTKKQTTYTAPDTASYFEVSIKPVAKTNPKTKKAYWSGDWCGWKKTYCLTYAIPDPPSVSIGLNEDGSTLTMRCDNLDDEIDYVQFSIVKNDKSTDTPKKVEVTKQSAKLVYNLAVDTKYKVRARANNIKTVKSAFSNKKYDKSIWSEWGEYTSEFTSRPKAPTDFVAKVKSENSVYLEWVGCDTATQYEIWYADDADSMETQSGPNFSKTTTESKDPRIIISGLEAGKKWFFRVRAVNSSGYSDWWKNPSDPKDWTQTVILGTKPEPPTTWSSAIVAKINNTDKVNLYWVHNSEDGSSERYSQLKLITNDGEPTIITLENTNKDEYGEYTDETRVHSIDTKDYSDGDELKWSVRTQGVWINPESTEKEGYGDWSIERSVKFYEEPSLDIDVLDSKGTPTTTITQFPIAIKCATFPSTANPIGFSINIEATESYSIDDDTGNTLYVSAGDSIYQKFIDGNSGDIKLGVGDLNLQNTMKYKIVGVASFDSGLTATNKDDAKTFEVAFDERLDKFTLDLTEITPDFDNLTVSINPKCYIDDEATDEETTETTETAELVEAENIVMSVYRREVNGKFTEIGTGAEDNSVSFTDPHPSLDIARYRIVVKDKLTGAMTYADIDYEMEETSIIINWNEEWSTLTTDDPDDFTPAWSGSMVKLPYNIDVTESNTMDVTLIEYIGRERPVSYYGTQLGENPQWTCEIPKYDTETIYQLRRLAVYKGDVYVREPSGTGFWASVAVSFNLKHTALTVPVTLNITPVEGGM